jgi:hypothetical protein
VKSWWLGTPASCTGAVLLVLSGLLASSMPVAAREPTARAAAGGLAASASSAARGAPTRLHSRGSPTWVYSVPRKGKQAIGYVRVGQSVALRDPAPRRGSGCGKGFVAIEPYGYVCLDRTATVEPKQRYVRAMQLLQPRQRPLPFDYALSNGAPMYRRLPSPEEWKQAERFFGPAGSFKPLSWGNRGHERLAEVRSISATDSVPFFLKDGGSVSTSKPLGLVRRLIPLGSMLSYTHTIEHAGRTFLVSADGTVVPADRVRPYRESTFRGVELGREAELPLAWIRFQSSPKYRRNADGSLTATALSWGVRDWIELEPDREPATHEGRTFFATRDRDRAELLWIAESDATVVRKRDKLPWGISEDDKWLIVSITRGTLVAYEGSRAIFTTLVSPGAGGVPVPGTDPVKMSTTPLGIYRITFKHVATTMSPEQGENRSFWIADVPYAQYFNGPFALHVAYWHEDFGRPMSAGCINISPRDGQRLFGWTEPVVPRDWAGAGQSALTGKGTFVVVTR